MRVLTVMGTRPEAIKMAPVIKALEREPNVVSATCTTGQHRDMVAPILNAFGVVPEWDLEAMAPGCTLNVLMARILVSIDTVFDAFRPDRVLVHGDTTTALASALAAFNRQIPVGHVEAGLRTGDFLQPWPEEMNRCVIDTFADMLFAPTIEARANLLAEGVLHKRIVTTGNTVIDALNETRARLHGDRAFQAAFRNRFPFCGAAGRRLLLVTGHRRENHASFEGICHALAALARRDDIHIVFPVHPNPSVRKQAMVLLGGMPNVSLIEPLDYADFVAMMESAHIILTDSGGVQEEAPSIGKPVLVLREATERPEAVASGVARLVGTDEGRIFSAVMHLLTDAAAYEAASHVANPYGDGRATHRIVDALLGRPVKEFGVDLLRPV